jgi:branched-chain amino acid transport system ATP-binding protein
MNPPLLAVAGLSKAFGGIGALLGVSFDVHQGELVALIGPNGAGKTTCFNLINGQLAADAGTVRLDGRRIDGLSPQSIAHAGIGRSFQVAATFASMTARENVELALIAHDRCDGQLAASPSRWRARADALLVRTGAGAIGEAHCASLPYAEVKRVELALALAAAPRLLLMDEPTAGMSVSMRGDVMRLVAGFARSDRLGVLFTEHDMDAVFSFADREIVLDRGVVIASGTPAEIRADRRVQAVYLGSDATA